jgi:hypothetical protein
VIRRATADDVPEMVRLCAEFHAYSPYRDVAEFDPEGFAAFAAGVIERGVAFMSEEGTLGGVLTSPYFNPGVVFAAELFWWARKGGQQLRAAFEDWGRENGAVAVQFSGLADERAPTITRVFRRAGYEPVELAFMKRL